MVANKPGHQGEREGNRKTIAQGMPVETGEPVALPVLFARSTGASDTRHSLRPLFGRSGDTARNAGLRQREDDEAWLFEMSMGENAAPWGRQSARFRRASNIFSVRLQRTGSPPTLRRLQ